MNSNYEILNNYESIINVLKEIICDKCLLPEEIQRKIQNFLYWFQLRQISILNYGFIDLPIEIEELSVTERNRIGEVFSKTMNEAAKQYVNINKINKLIENNKNAISDFQKTIEINLLSAYKANFENLLKLMKMKNQVVPEEFNQRAHSILLICQAIDYKTDLMEYQLKKVFIEKKAHIKAFEALLNKLIDDNKKLKNVYDNLTSKESTIELIKQDKRLVHIFHKYVLMKKLQLSSKLPSSSS